MEKRVILAILISTIVLFFYNLYLYRSAERLKALTETKREEPSSSPFPPFDPPSTEKGEIKKLFVRTGPSEVQLTPKGEIKSLKLIRFKEKESNLSVDLVRPASLVYPLEILLSDAILLSKGFESLNPWTKEFVYQTTQPKTEIKKRIIFEQDTYLIKVELEVTNPSKENLILESFGLGWRGGRTNLSSGRDLGEVGQLYLSGGKRGKVLYKNQGVLEKIAIFLGLIPEKRPQQEESVIQGDISWIAQQERYFLTTIIPEWTGPKKAFFRKTEDAFLEMGLVIPQLLIPPCEKKAVSFKIYAGPKDHNELKALYPGAERLTGLNNFSLLTLKILRLLYKFTHNYGLAIILLAIIIKIILHPFTQASLKSMKLMQKLAPEVNTLKKRYADDRERLNREIMALYKRYKINPLSGCLPILVQLPFLYAIFTTLRLAIDLRGAPFILWMKDLSDKDPYYVLPILMGVSMFIQQKMSIQDPQQVKALLLIPLIFTFLFLNFPSGLVLYWLFQNILSIGQTYLINRSK